MDKISYALGLSVGENLRASGIENLNIEDFTAGFVAILKGEKPELDQKEVQELLNAYFTELSSKIMEKNKLAGEEFLQRNGSRSEVTTLPSGVQYEILVEGKGEKPKLTDKVECHYHGTLVDGKVFDSSVERGTPAEFPVNGVIKGWQEILQLMPVGSKWKVAIPFHLAYGTQGAGRDIMPYSALVFEIELLDIK